MGLQLRVVVGSADDLGGCYDRLEALVKQQDRAGTVLSRRKLLWLLDAPQRYLTRRGCYDGPPFMNRVDSVFADFLALEDDTFLMIDHEHGVIVRFDAAFRSQSPLLNQQLFVVDEATFGSWQSHLKNVDSEDVGFNLQILQDALYDSLMKRRPHP